MRTLMRPPFAINVIKHLQTLSNFINCGEKQNRMPIVLCFDP